jgi:hypothetical protein
MVKDLASLDDGFAAPLCSKFFSSASCCGFSR